MDTVNTRPATRRNSSRGAGSSDQTVTTTSSSPYDPNSSNNVAKAASSQHSDHPYVSENSETNPGQERPELGSNISSLQPHDKHTASQQQEGGDSNGMVEETPGNGKRKNHSTRSRTPKPRGQPKDEDLSQKVSD